jgi:hypothetical protein
MLITVYLLGKGTNLGWRKIKRRLCSTNYHTGSKTHDCFRVMLDAIVSIGKRDK